MKILYNIPSLTGIGGVEKVISAKANWLADNGYEVVIVTAFQGGAPFYFPIDPRIKCIDLGMSTRFAGNPLLRAVMRPARMMRQRRSLKKILFEERPDITVMTGQDIGFGIKDGSKKISEYHATYSARFKERKNNPFRFVVNTLFLWLKKSISGRYDAFVVLTEEDGRDWQKRGEMQNLRVIPNFIKGGNERSTLQHKQAIAVGRLVYVKRFDRLIAAWEHVCKAHPDWTLKIYGDGPLKEPLNRLIAEKGLGDAVKLCGSTKEIMKMYGESSVMISTSACEGFHMGMLEAMSCGLPIVSFDYKCGPRTLIDDGKSGFIVPEGDTEGLAEKICRIIEDEELRKSMGERSYKKSLEFDEDAVMQKWASLFCELNDKN